MIYITQGHERSIGLEVFLKSFLLLSNDDQRLFKLFTFKKTFNDSVKHSNIAPSSLSNLDTLFLDSGTTFESTLSLEKALSSLDARRDILLTLPTSKDQLVLDGQLCAGHTEFFRKYFKFQATAMVFSYSNENMLLISDHIPIKDVPSYITKDLIVNKVSVTIKGFSRYLNPLNHIIFSGINPHAGENGLLGNEDLLISDAIKELDVLFPNIRFSGPYSGDSLHNYATTPSTLKVYMYHDQGLSYFKSRFKTIGQHFTFGLPFLRMSVDHGTAFNLYGKNTAQYLGCYFLLKKALNIARGFNEHK